jgi:hypothetical protein
MQTDKLANFSADEKLKCVARAIALRRRVYPSRIVAGKMRRQEFADREIAIMLAIAKDYGGYGE